MAPYVARVEGDDALSALEAQVADFDRVLGACTEADGARRYAPGKWSVKEVLGHVVDCERIYAYRALLFARADETELPGFDEGRYVPAGRFDERTLADLLAEWRTARAATLALFRGLPSEALSRRGVANGHLVSVRALAWLAVGHAAHHLGILGERYALAAARG
jgi:uncharacterized damage-inducible protein DinB